MTFGIDAFDWTKVNAALRKDAETFYAPVVGDSWPEATPDATIAILTDFETPVLPQFDYYDGETDAVQDVYEVYLWAEESIRGVWNIITTKTTEGATTVVNVTPLTMLYRAPGEDGAGIITSDSNVEGVEVDDNGDPISEPPLTSGSADANTMYTEEIQEVFDNDIDTDTAWTPDYVLNLEEVYLKDSATNSDTTTWYRIKSRNGQETIHWFWPTDVAAESFPKDFTYGTGTSLYTIGATQLDPEEGKVHEVAGTSLNYVGLGSTYDSVIADLSTAYDALGAGLGLAGPCADKPNSTLNDSTGECDCDTDYEEDDTGKCVAITTEPTWSDKIGVWFSSTGTSIKQGWADYKWWIIGGVVIVSGGGAWLLKWLKKGKETVFDDPPPPTVGEKLDEALGSGKAIEE